MSNYFKKIKQYYIYNRDHRREVVRIEKQCLGYNTIITKMHDVDKLIMFSLGVPKRWVSKIHRWFSWHHVGNKIGWFRINEAIFDWESCRFTKPDKPENARETCEKLYPHLKNDVFKLCDKYGLK